MLIRDTTKLLHSLFLHAFAIEERDKNWVISTELGRKEVVFKSSAKRKTSRFETLQKTMHSIIKHDFPIAPVRGKKPIAIETRSRGSLQDEDPDHVQLIENAKVQNTIINMRSLTGAQCKAVLSKSFCVHRDDREGYSSKLGYEQLIDVVFHNDGVNCPGNEACYTSSPSVDQVNGDKILCPKCCMQRLFHHFRLMVEITQSIEGLL
jgi:hypothetical protein